MKKIITIILLFSVINAFAQKCKTPYCTILEKYDGNVHKEELVLGTPIIVHNLKNAKVIYYEIFCMIKGFWEIKKVESDNIDSTAFKIINLTYNGSTVYFTNVKCIYKNDTIELNSMHFKISDDYIAPIDLLPSLPNVCNKYSGKILKTELIDCKRVDTSLDSNKYKISSFYVNYKRCWGYKDNNTPFFTESDIDYFKIIPLNQYLFIDNILVTDKSGKIYILPPIVLQVK